VVPDITSQVDGRHPTTAELSLDLIAGRERDPKSLQLIGQGGGTPEKPTKEEEYPRRGRAARARNWAPQGTGLPRRSGHPKAVRSSRAGASVYRSANPRYRARPDRPRPARYLRKPPRGDPASQGCPVPKQGLNGSVGACPSSGQAAAASQLALNSVTFRQGGAELREDSGQVGDRPATGK